jgi:hypothetical protein
MRFAKTWLTYEGENLSIDHISFNNPLSSAKVNINVQ